MKKLASALTILLLACSTSSAAEYPQWVVSGVGLDSCASYVLALHENRPTAAIEMEGKTYYTMANAYTQWITGFVTAANISGQPTRQIKVDVNGIALWVKNYCDANPSENIVAAASAFVRTHRLKAK